MNSEANTQIVKDFFVPVGKHDEQHLLSLVTEDIEWVIPGGGWPLTGAHRGHEELAAVLQKASAEVEMTYPEPPEFVAQGDRVMVVGVATGKINAIGFSTLPFEMAKSRRSESISTRKHWRGPLRRLRAPGTDPLTHRATDAVYGGDPRVRMQSF